jgi:ribosomal protein S18 acetylase RimI-like enzyme
MTVSLREMTDAEFGAWSAASIEGYIDDIIASSGLTREAARARAEAQWEKFLPSGRHTPGVWLMTVRAGDRAVGSLWLGQHPDRSDAAYVYDIVIDDGEQGRGYGRAAMLAAEDVAREAGLVAIGLNVFGFNARAQGLYDSLGYSVVSTQMLKELS